MKTGIMTKLYPGISNVNERISTEAVARANALLFAANQISAYVEAALRQLATVNNMENA